MILLFEDEKVADLSPVTLTRPAYAISCGGFTLLELAASSGIPVLCRTRAHLAHRARKDSAPNTAPGQGYRLALNARCAPRHDLPALLANFLSKEEPFLASREGSVLAAGLDSSSLGTIPENAREFTDWLLNLGLPEVDLDIPLFEYPHDILRHHLSLFQDSLRLRIEKGTLSRQGTAEVYFGQEVHLAPNAYIDASAGPVVVESGATVGPFAYLQGPCLVGAGSRVIDHASVKEFTATGNTVKIGGEVEGSILEAFTNKQHHGFLGHAYLGSWVNLGAGTSNSDLKNTYGRVNMEYDRRQVPTGMQFMGCVIGDYSKTAINTSIFTGKIIGVCSYVYGFVTTNVPSFCNYARSFGQITEIPPSVATTTQERMFLRRGIVQQPEDIDLIEAAYQLTHHERRISDEQISL